MGLRSSFSFTLGTSLFLFASVQSGNIFVEPEPEDVNRQIQLQRMLDNINETFSHPYLECDFGQAHLVKECIKAAINSSSSECPLLQKLYDCTHRGFQQCKRATLLDNFYTQSMQEQGREMGCAITPGGEEDSRLLLKFASRPPTYSEDDENIGTSTAKSIISSTQAMFRTNTTDAPKEDPK